MGNIPYDADTRYSFQRMNWNERNVVATLPVQVEITTNENYFNEHVMPLKKKHFGVTILLQVVNKIHFLTFACRKIMYVFTIMDQSN